MKRLCLHIARLPHVHLRCKNNHEWWTLHTEVNLLNRHDSCNFIWQKSKYFPLGKFFGLKHTNKEGKTDFFFNKKSKAYKTWTPKRSISAFSKQFSKVKIIFWIQKCAKIWNTKQQQRDFDLIEYKESLASNMRLQNPFNMISFEQIINWNEMNRLNQQ